MWSSLITGNVEYEVPGIIEIENNMWKGKADIINHDEKLIIEPVKKKSLLEVLATLEDIDEDFPDIDQGLLPLDNIEL